MTSDNAGLLAAYGELCDLLGEERLLKERHREERKEVRDRLEAAYGAIDSVLYEDRADFGRGVVERWRRDTGEKCSERAMTAEERQLHLSETDPDVPRPQRPAHPDIEAEIDDLEAHRAKAGKSKVKG